MIGRRASIQIAAPAAASAVAGCGSSSGGSVTAPKVGAARTYALSGFGPVGAILPGRPTSISFTIRTPAGTPLTAYIVIDAYPRHTSPDSPINHQAGFLTVNVTPGRDVLHARARLDRVTGSPSAPSRLKVGVLLPVPGRRRMFLLTYLDGLS